MEIVFKKQKVLWRHKVSFKDRFMLDLYAKVVYDDLKGIKDIVKAKE